MIKKKKETTFKDILETFLPKLWVMLLVGAILAAAVCAYSSFLKKDTYTSTSTVYVFADKGTSSSTSTGDLQAAEQMVNVYKIAITGEKFLKMVCVEPELVEYDLTPAKIKGMLSIQQVDDSPIFKISITSADATMSYKVACVITSGIASKIQGDEGIIKNALQSSVFEDPALAEVSNSKNIVRNAIIAFLVGFVVTAVAVWINSLFDVVIRSTKKIEDNLDIPILGVIPRHEISSSEEVGA